MSYDVSIGKWSGNFTFNSLGKLCRVHLDRGDGLKSLDGMTGKEAAEKILRFWGSVNAERVKHLSSDIVGEPKFCSIYDSENGWGSLVGALVFMGELTAACAKHQNAKIVVSA